MREVTYSDAPIKEMDTWKMVTLFLLFIGSLVAGSLFFIGGSMADSRSHTAEIEAAYNVKVLEFVPGSKLQKMIVMDGDVKKECLRPDEDGLKRALECTTIADSVEPVK